MYRNTQHQSWRPEQTSPWFEVRQESDRVPCGHRVRHPVRRGPFSGLGDRVQAGVGVCLCVFMVCV